MVMMMTRLAPYLTIIALGFPKIASMTFILTYSINDLGLLLFGIFDSHVIN